jgi:cell division protein FtsB
MSARIVAVLLIAALLALQYRLWISPNGMRDLWRTEAAIEAQTAENARLSERNRRLAAEVNDLKEGRAAIEERARTDLGMIGADETFFQELPVAPGTTPDPDQEERRTAEAAPR